MAIVQLYEAWIQGTEPGALIELSVAPVRWVTRENKTEETILITTVALKHIADRHLYGKRAAEKELLALLKSFELAIQNPSRILANHERKRGSILLVREGATCVIENFSDRPSEVVTGFFAREKYLRKFPVLWSREDGDSSIVTP